MSGLDNHRSPSERDKCRRPTGRAYCRLRLSPPSLFCRGFFGGESFLSSALVAGDDERGGMDNTPIGGSTGALIANWCFVLLSVDKEYNISLLSGITLTAGFFECCRDAGA